MIYFVKAEKDTPDIKAGWIKCGTTIRLSVRLKQIAGDIGHMPTLLAVADGSYPEEKVIHERFSRLREHGEWFRPEPDLCEFIRTDGMPWDGIEPPILCTSVKLNADVIETARIVAALRNVSMTDLMSDILDPILSEMEDQCVAERMRTKAERAC